MRSNRLWSTLVLIAAVALTSCTKEVLTDPADLPLTNQLRIVTRAGGDGTGETTTIQSGRIYFFNSSDQCIKMLTTDEDTQPSATLFPAGSFSVYAVGGGSDLAERITLPTQDEARPTSVLTLADGKVMDDLLMQHTQVTLTDGEERTLTITLGRAVLFIDQITIKKVPASVTKVDVVLEPFYKQVRLDGTFPADTEPVTIALASQGDQTWQSQQAGYHFPSSGCPTVTVRFTYDDSTVKSFTYTTAEELEANHKVKIEGTYTQAQGVDLTGILQGIGWGEDKLITFDFDDTNSSDGQQSGGGNSGGADVPVQGSFYKNCFVVSVSGNTATLLSPDEKANCFTAVDQGAAAGKAVLENALATWASVDGVSGTWRIPTVDEAKVFMADENAVPGVTISSKWYWCLNNGVLNSISVRLRNGNREVDESVSTLRASSLLRPVIDITF